MTQATKIDECGACHQVFTNQDDIWSHDCPGIAAKAEQLRQEFSGKFVTRQSNFGTGTTTLPAPGAFRTSTGKPTPRSTETKQYNPISKAQIKYIRDLLADREGNIVAENVRRELNVHRTNGTLTTVVASDYISKLRQVPKGACKIDPMPVVIVPENRVVQGEPSPTIQAGRYAIMSEDGTLKFYTVDTPTEGRWAGRVFVKVWASDEKHSIRNAAERSRIIAEIAKDPKEALLRFGREIGKCGRCGRTLTDAESRAKGIGPICEAKEGW